MISTHRTRSTNGAPQVVAVVFAALIFFMLLLPFVRISVDGAIQTRLLMQLLSSEAGSNGAVLVLLLVPLFGIAEAMMAPMAWRGLSAGIAALAILMLALTFFLFYRGLQHTAGGHTSIAPGIGSYILLVGYLIIAITTGIAAIRSTHIRRVT